MKGKTIRFLRIKIEGKWYHGRGLLGEMVYLRPMGYTHPASRSKHIQWGKCPPEYREGLGKAARAYYRKWEGKNLPKAKAHSCLGEWYLEITDHNNNVIKRLSA